MATRRKVITTVNDLTRRSLLGMRKSEQRTKVSEIDSKKLIRRAMRSLSNRLIDAKISFYGTYVQLNEQVTLQNQDPKLILA